MTSNTQTDEGDQAAAKNVGEYWSGVKPQKADCFRAIQRATTETCAAMKKIFLA